MNNLLIALIFCSTSIAALGQGKSVSLGVAGGLTRGINEAFFSERVIGPLFGFYGLYNNGLGSGLTPEFSFQYFTNGTDKYGGWSQYKTTYIVPELRLRYQIINSSILNPYVFGGLGATMYDVLEKPSNPDPTAKFSGVTLSISVGAGITYWINPKFGIDFQAGLNTSMTDNFNPYYDKYNDGSWVTRLGVHYNIFDIAKDSDGDGLSDDEEIKLGSNPNNPDSDGDGLTDGDEVNKYKTDPLNPDTDGGGINDGAEVAAGTNPLEADDDILAIPVGGKMILKNVEFDVAKADLKKSSEKTLSNAVKALTKAQNVEIEIVGHTDNQGDRDKNVKLSLDRAETVKNWLIDKGISGTRLKTRGMGPDEPLVPNTTDENRQRNRRVELIRSK
ncbi:MAG: OmpA family protein [Candidatus Kapabacteria bacterium]|nr:OmpA family protein [Candidatus Kapabacteria bacterium]